MADGRDDASTLRERALKAHAGGKIEAIGKVAIKSAEDLSTYYTPGVAYASMAIAVDKGLSYTYTSRSNMIAIVSDGSRVLGLGDIGPEAGMPVMEGKALLFKKFGGVDAIPLTINAHSVEEIVAFVKALEPSFAGINLEDIATPKNFEVFNRLKAELRIPVFHDDRHGVSVVVHAALKNALRLTGRKLSNARIVINGAGAAGMGTAELLLAEGAKDITVCDSKGAIYAGRDADMSPMKADLASKTNRKMVKGPLQAAVEGADVLIGLSVKGAFTKELIKSMSKNPIVFALANPDSEISYKDAKDAGAAVVATGASDAPNQVNNLLAFPAIFRGALDVRAREINTKMLLAASNALSGSVAKSKLSNEYIVPAFCNERFQAIVAKTAAAVAKAAMDSGVAGTNVDINVLKKGIKSRLKRYGKIERLVSRL
jgi:malate dehydrogenase (oxaloacetate-decarboxylating)